MRREGARIRTVTLPPLSDFEGVNRTILMAEAAAIHGGWLRDRPEAYADLARKRLLP